MFKMVTLPPWPKTISLIPVERHELQAALHGYLTALCRHCCTWTNTGYRSDPPAGVTAADVTFPFEEVEALAADLALFIGQSPDAQLWVAGIRETHGLADSEAWAYLGAEFAVARNRVPEAANFALGRVESVSIRLAAWAFAQGEQHVVATAHTDGSCTARVVA